MSFVLRDYQKQLIIDARNALRVSESVLVQLSTGGGKTALSAFMAGSAAAKGKRVYFGVHRQELVKQTAKTFAKVGIPFGIIAAGFTGDRHQPVQIVSIPTLAARFDRYPAPDLYIPDEAHHSGAKTWSDVAEAYLEAGAKLVGLSATPERMDGTGLGKWFGRMVSGPSTAWLIEEGFLSPFEQFAPHVPDLKGVKKTGGDFNKAQLGERMGSPSVTGDAVAHYTKLTAGRKAMVFCVSIKHSLSVVERFQAAGYRAAHIDGDSPNRDALISAFERGEIQVLSAVDLVSEGFDLPAIETAIMLRPTSSLGLYLQQVGRVLRSVYADGFDLSTKQGRVDAIEAGPKPYAVILDHAGNSLPKEAGGRGHGLPDDDRVWTLEGRQKKKRGEGEEDEEPAVQHRQCPNCYRVHEPAPKCPKCGHEYPFMGRTVEEVAGELVKITKAEKAAKREAAKVEERAAKSVEELIAIGKARGYPNPAGWARNYFKARESRKQVRYVR